MFYLRSSHISPRWFLLAQICRQNHTHSHIVWTFIDNVYSSFCSPSPTSSFDSLPHQPAQVTKLVLNCNSFPFSLYGASKKHIGKVSLRFFAITFFFTWFCLGKTSPIFSFFDRLGNFEYNYFTWSCVSEDITFTLSITNRRLYIETQRMAGTGVNETYYY